MLPTFLVEETTVRESGESMVFDASECLHENLLLTFGITHAVEQESIEVIIRGSQDGILWTAKPLVSFAPKFYCGTYQLILPRCEAHYLKVSWKLSRWSRDGHRPFFSFYLFAQPARAHIAVAGAA